MSEIQKKKKTQKNSEKIQHKIKNSENAHNKGKKNKKLKRKKHKINLQQNKSVLQNKGDDFGEQ